MQHANIDANMSNKDNLRKRLEHKQHQTKMFKLQTKLLLFTFLVIGLAFISVSDGDLNTTSHVQAHERITK